MLFSAAIAAISVYSFSEVFSSNLTSKSVAGCGCNKLRDPTEFYEKVRLRPKELPPPRLSCESSLGLAAARPSNAPRLMLAIGN